ncbi:hypothetical protein [Sorangium sp. So ce204]
MGAIDDLPCFEPAAERLWMGAFYVPRTMVFALLDCRSQHAAIE